MRTVRAISITLAVSAGAATASPTQPDQHRWENYGNRRYGYSVCYPADLFRPGPESGARDGVLFAGRDRVTLSVSGEPSSGTSMGEVMDALTRSLDGRVSYRAAKPGWMVASGTKGPDTFYARLVGGGGVIAQYVLVYPKAKAAIFAPIVKRMNGCLRIS